MKKLFSAYTCIIKMRESTRQCMHAVEEKIYRTARLVHKKQGGKERLCAPRRFSVSSLIYVCVQAIMRGEDQTFILFWRNACTRSERSAF